MGRGRRRRTHEEADDGEVEDARVDEAEDLLARHHLLHVVRRQHRAQRDGPVGELGAVGEDERPDQSIW